MMPIEEVKAGFKAAMRRQASTIAIITVSEGGAWNGMAATAVCSVSADPPSLVIGVNKSASMHDTIHTGQVFCVNLLRLQHQELVAAFSGSKKGAERFDHGHWATHSSGVPYLKEALAVMFCKVRGHMEYGTHTLFVGEVDEVTVHDTIDPLVWQDGRFVQTNGL